MSVIYEEGRYRVRVTAQAFGQNKNNKVCAGIEFSPSCWLTDAAGQQRNEDIDGDVIGRRSQSFFFVTDENARISIEQLRGLGWTGQDFDDLAKWQELVGKELVAKCVHERIIDQQGEERQIERWTIFTPGKPLSERVTKPEAKATRELQSRFGNLLKGTAAPASAAPRTPRKKPDPKPADDANNDQAAETDAGQAVPF